MKESSLVRKIIKEVARLFPRALVVKHSDRFRRGDPDLEILFPRRVVGTGLQLDVGVLFVETKRPEGGVLAPIQQAAIDRINRLVGLHGGCQAIVADSVDEVINTLAKMGCVS